jgi:hypothetical protein
MNAQQSHTHGYRQGYTRDRLLCMHSPCVRRTFCDQRMFQTPLSTDLHKGVDLSLSSTPVH